MADRRPRWRLERPRHAVASDRDILGAIVKIRQDEALGRAAVDAIHKGDVVILSPLLNENPGLARAIIGGARPVSGGPDESHAGARGDRLVRAFFRVVPQCLPRWSTAMR